ncbi:hypothetical protein SCALIN_C04_0116 [Candidatus Scalindua japonica]|uniref:4Fe-4S domain-containing protein n=1 Tax=Candidatus Scalindua japonica TaxID=1284222 RepID=A0A286TUR6_9BACT|nr:DUF3786 domain-containing protein [Candidatus Scalindua japonica]GAX59628.1 hypothetical protein SCALIN_C04_0116 [Candidatus Scalindua japonica]
MIDIYKKLPGNNCGECGESTCMAFALKVTSAQRKMSECPYVKQEDEVSVDQESVVTIENNYKRVSRELEKEIKDIDLKEAADAIGGNYDKRNGRGSIRLKMMNKEYEVNNEGLFADAKYVEHSWSKIIIYDYVRRKGEIPLTGDWVSMGHFPDAASHSKAFQKNAEDKIAEKFNNDLTGLVSRCRELEGFETIGKLKADYICGFKLLPCVPLYLCFWEADDEYSASCKLHVDRNAEAYLDIEYLAYLLEWFVKIFVE